MKWNNENIPNLYGKIAIITGSNSGIGFETAKILAKKEATVILACRNIQKGEKALQRINSEINNAKLEFIQLDLSDLKSVHQFTETFKQKHNALHLLINNAGVMMPPYGKTKDGFELQFGTNHLGHFALTGLLLDVLIKTDNSRIVSVSSLMHKYGKVNFDDLNREKKYDKSEAYGQSKLSNLLFIYELQRRLTNKGLSTIAAASHPGWTRTNLQRHSGSAAFLNPIFGQLPDMGVLPTLMAATHPDVKGGDFYGPGGFMEMKGYPKKVQSNKMSHDKAIAKNLWEVSEELTKVKYSF